MSTRERKAAAPSARHPAIGEVANGPAWAAYLAAGIGSFALGFVVLLNEAGIYSIPALYAPAGGVSGRTTLATVVWLSAWAILHARWKTRDIDSSRVGVITFLLIALGMLGLFPPLWSLL
jgi:hypothetical protein